MTINKNDKFLHIETGNIYRIIGNTKIKIDFKWVDGIIYTSDDLDFGDLYTREINEFRDKFDKVYQ